MNSPSTELLCQRTPSTRFAFTYILIVLLTSMRGKKNKDEDISRGHIPIYYPSKGLKWDLEGGGNPTFGDGEKNVL